MDFDELDFIMDDADDDDDYEARAEAAENVRGYNRKAHMSNAEEQKLRKELYNTIVKNYFPNNNKLKKATYFITQYWIDAYLLSRRAATLENNAEQIKRDFAAEMEKRKYTDARQIVWCLISRAILIEQREDFVRMYAQG